MDVLHFPSEAAEDLCQKLRVLCPWQDEILTWGKMNYVRKYKYFMDQWSSLAAYFLQQKTGMAVLIKHIVNRQITQ